MLANLATLVMRRRWIVIGAWIVLTFAGAFAAGQLSKRWFESFSIPGFPAYEANQRTLKTFGSGEQAPLVAVFTTDRDITTVPGVQQAIDATAKQIPGNVRVGSWFATHSNAYLSKDRHAMVATIYPPGNANFDPVPKTLKKMRATLQKAAPDGVTVHLTGLAAIIASQGESSGPSVLTEALIGGAGALIILLFVFGTLPAVAMPLLVAMSSILTTFLCVYGLTYVTHVSIIVQFLVALVGLGVAIDYALLVVFRFREELTTHDTTEEALVETMTHAGRSVIVSGSTVAIGLVSMLLLPLPFIRSIGLGGMLIPVVSVLASITLLPAMLSLLGPKINRLRVMPKKFVEPHSPEDGFWGRWSRVVLRRPALVFVIGVAIVAVVISPAFHINPADAQLKDQPAHGDAAAGRAAIAAAGLPAGVYLPYVMLVENGASPTTLASVVDRLDKTPGIYGAAAPPAWRNGGTGLVEAFATDDGNSRASRHTISSLKDDVLPQLQADLKDRVSLGGFAPEARDFVHAVYGKFPYVLLFVLVLTFVLLMRAFRSILLPLKAVLLNLVSLGAAYGIVVFIFQDGHGSKAIWDLAATNAIISWIPLMIFAFLFGISMDYEVFIVTRVREEYDETGDTPHAIAHGLARTGKLVTSASLVLMFAFFTLSTGPGPDIKQFAIGLAAGIVFDATVIRALLVPATMQLLGKWNWWLPAPVARILRVAPSEV